MYRQSIVFIIVLFLLIFKSQDAYAYLDPGTGSMLFSVVIGLVSTAYFAIRKIPNIVHSFFFRIRGGKQNILKRNHIVIYAESAAYWSTFRPILIEFSHRQEQVLYLTSDINDPALKMKFPNYINVKFIGTGNIAYMTLNLLEADALVLTTPGIGVLQIKRSKGVSKYIHILHTITDFHLYKYFSFDYYDVIICNGEYQVKTMRALEYFRHTKKKELPIIGCPYFDGLVERYEIENITQKNIEEKCVLVAPTWGVNSMITRYGSIVPKILAEAGYKVIFRPHPQMSISQKELLNKIEQELKLYKNIEIDYQPDGFLSMSRARVLVSDISGIIFDFAFVFLRPVVTLLYETKKDGFEIFDIPNYPFWDKEVIKEFGCQLDAESIEKLPLMISQLLQSQNMKNHIKAIRNESVANFGHSAIPIVEAICNIASTR